MGLAKALKRWEDKKPEIVRSLSSVGPLREWVLRTCTYESVTIY